MEIQNEDNSPALVFIHNFYYFLLMYGRKWKRKYSRDKYCFTSRNVIVGGKFSI